MSRKICFATFMNRQMAATPDEESPGELTSAPRVALQITISKSAHMGRLDRAPHRLKLRL